MTHRERLEAKTERLREWAAKREASASAQLSSHPEMRHDWAFITQPGHIPARARMNAADDRAFESLQKAKSMTGRAAGLEQQLDRSIFSDDPDAIAALEARVAELEAKRDAMKAANKTGTLPLCNYQAEGVVAVSRFGGADLHLRQIAMTKAEYAAMHRDYRSTYTVSGSHRIRGAMVRHELVCVFLSDIKATPPPAPATTTGLKPYATWELTNIGAEIRRNKQRIEDVRARQTLTARAKAAGGVTVEGDERVHVTFAEKPERIVIEALKAAGFWWNGVSWWGQRDALPTDIFTLQEAAEANRDALDSTAPLPPAQTAPELPASPA